MRACTAASGRSPLSVRRGARGSLLPPWSSINGTWPLSASRDHCPIGPTACSSPGSGTPSQWPEGAVRLVGRPCGAAWPASASQVSVGIEWARFELQLRGRVPPACLQVRRGDRCDPLQAAWVQQHSRSQRTGSHRSGQVMCSCGWPPLGLLQRLQRPPAPPSRACSCSTALPRLGAQLRRVPPQLPPAPQPQLAMCCCFASPTAPAWRAK